MRGLLKIAYGTENVPVIVTTFIMFIVYWPTIDNITKPVRALGIFSKCSYFVVSPFFGAFTYEMDMYEIYWRQAFVHG